MQYRIRVTSSEPSFDIRIVSFLLLCRKWLQYKFPSFSDWKVRKRTFIRRNEQPLERRKVSLHFLCFSWHSFKTREVSQEEGVSYTCWSSLSWSGWNSRRRRRKRRKQQEDWSPEGKLFISLFSSRLLIKDKREDIWVSLFILICNIHRSHPFVMHWRKDATPDVMSRKRNGRRREEEEDGTSSLFVKGVTQEREEEEIQVKHDLNLCRLSRQPND